MMAAKRTSTRKQQLRRRQRHLQRVTVLQRKHARHASEHVLVGHHTHALACSPQWPQLVAQQGLHASDTVVDIAVRLPPLAVCRCSVGYVRCVGCVGCVRCVRCVRCGSGGSGWRQLEGRSSSTSSSRGCLGIKILSTCIPLLLIPLLLLPLLLFLLVLLLLLLLRFAFQPRKVHRRKLSPEHMHWPSRMPVEERRVCALQLVVLTQPGIGHYLALCRIREDGERCLQRSCQRRHQNDVERSLA